MADFGTPVAASVNPTQGLQSLQSLMAIKSASNQQALQQQALQTGQFQQQTAAAQAQQEGLKAQQQQGVQNFFSTWDPTQHRDDDGTTDLDSALQSDQFKSAGNAKPAIMQSLLDLKNKQLTNKQSLTTLNSDNLNVFSRGIGALAKDDDVVADKTDPVTGVNAGRAKVDQFMQNFSKLGPDAARVAQIFGPITQHVPPGKLSSGIQALQMMGEDVSGQQGQQNPAQVSVGTGVNTQIYNVNRATGLAPGQRPVATIANDTPPENVVGPNSQIIHVGARGAGLPPASATAAAPPTDPNKLQPLIRPGVNAPKADQDAYNQQISDAQKLTSATRTAANDPSKGTAVNRYRNQQVLALIPQLGMAQSGPGNETLNFIASHIPGYTEGADAYQVIEHYLAQSSADMAAKMNVPNTNLGQETAAAAAGNMSRNPAALAEIVKTNDALNTAFDLFNRGLDKATNGGSDMSKVNSYQQQFGSNMDLNAIRWADAHRRKDQQEIAKLQQNLGPQGIAGAQSKLKVLKSLSETGDLP